MGRGGYSSQNIYSSKIHQDNCAQGQVKISDAINYSSKSAQVWKCNNRVVSKKKEKVERFDSCSCCEKLCKTTPEIPWKYIILEENSKYV